MSKAVHKKLCDNAQHSAVGDRVEDATNTFLYLAVRKRLGIPRFRFLFRFIVPLRNEVQKR